LPRDAGAWDHHADVRLCRPRMSAETDPHPWRTLINNEWAQYLPPTPAEEVNMNKLSTLWKKIKVVAKAAPPWLAAAVLIIPIVAEEAVKHLPDHVAVTVAAVAASAVAILSSVIVVIRRVTPVLPWRRGLL